MSDPSTVPSWPGDPEPASPAPGTPRRDPTEPLAPTPTEPTVPTPEEPTFPAPAEPTIPIPSEPTTDPDPDHAHPRRPHPRRTSRSRRAEALGLPQAAGTGLARATDGPRHPPAETDEPSWPPRRRAGIVGITPDGRHNHVDDDRTPRPHRPPREE